MMDRMGYESTVLITAVAALVAAVVGMLGLVLMWRESCRNNNVIVKMRECGVWWVVVESKPWGIFKVVLENRGRALHDVQVELIFGGEGGDRTFCTCGMRADNGELVLGGEFAKGMVGVFAFDTKWMCKEDFMKIGYLRDVRKQRAHIYVFSQRHLVKVFQVGRWWERVKWKGFQGLCTVRDRVRKHMGREKVLEVDFVSARREEFVRPVVMLPHLEGFVGFCREHFAERGEV